MERLHDESGRVAGASVGMIAACAMTVSIARRHLTKIAAASSFVGTLTVHAPVAYAQVPPAPVAAAPVAATPGAGTRVLAAADTLTLGDYCIAARRVMTPDTVRKVLGTQSSVVAINIERLCDPRVASFSLRSLTGSEPASLRAVARQKQGAYHEVGRLPLDSIFTIVDRELRDDEPRKAIRASLSAADAQAFVNLSETARRVFLADAGQRSLEHLSNYERKLGPQSPKLNAIEVLLNYSAQRWVPGFAPSIARGPSPLELIASYVPTYATIADKRAAAVSASEFGIRGYLFGKDWGATGKAGLLKPAYWSLGALVASDKSGALAWPWDGKTRTGAFIGWGEVKVGYVPGRKGALVLTRQMQIIPFVF